MSDLIRTFIAVEITDSIKRQISDLEDILKREHSKVSWVKLDNLHLTLKFLGNVEEARITDVLEGTEQATRGIKAFSVSFSGLGAFPNLKRPRVIWIGIEKGAERLEEIQAKIEEELSQRGFAREERKFSPHLTIGRVKSQQNISQLISAIENTEFDSEKMMADRVVVMRSDLRPTGAVYTPLGVCELVS